MTIHLPPFPVDEATVDLILSACRPSPSANRSSITDLCKMYAEMAGSDLDAIEDESDGFTVMRDPCYHYNDVIEALAYEVRRLRNRAQ